MIQPAQGDQRHDPSDYSHRRCNENQNTHERFCSASIIVCVLT